MEGCLALAAHITDHGAVNVGHQHVPAQRARHQHCTRSHRTRVRARPAHAVSVGHIFTGHKTCAVRCVCARLNTLVHVHVRVSSEGCGGTCTNEQAGDGAHAAMTK